MRSHPDGYGNGYFFAICYAPLSDLYYVADDKRGYPARGHEVFVDDSGKKIAIAIGNPRAEFPWRSLARFEFHLCAEATWTQSLRDWIGAHKRNIPVFW